MKFKGTHQDVTLRGIELAGSDRAIAAGGMNELVGLVERDGKWEPYGLTNEYYKSPFGVKQFLVHKTSYGDNVLQLQSGGNLLWKSKADFESGVGTWHPTGLTGVTEVALVGNMITDQNINSVVFRNTGYAKMDTTIDRSSLPDVQLRVRCDYPFSEKIGDSRWGHSIFAIQDLASPTETYGTGVIPVEKYKSDIKVLAQKVISQWAEKGGLTGYVMAVVAFRLTNGEYILASVPQIYGAPWIKYYDGTLQQLNIITGDLTPSDQNVYANKPPVIIPEWAYDYTNVGGVWGYSLNSQGIGAMSEIQFSNDECHILKTDGSSQDYSIHAIPTIFGLVEKEDYSDPNRVIQYRGVVSSRANVLEYYIDSDISSEYSSSIESVCIFITKQVQAFSFEPDKLNTSPSAHSYASNTGSGYMSGYFPSLVSVEDIREELKKCTSFYKVKEIPFNEIKETSGWVSVDLKGKLGDGLYTLPTLPPSAFSNTKTFGGKLFTYNNRIHTFGYSQKPSELSGISQYRYNGGYGQHHSWGATATGQWRVIARCKSSSYGEYELEVNDTRGALLTFYFFGGMICYPNPDCYELEIIMQMGSNTYSHVFTMEQWQEVGLSVYYPSEPAIKPIDWRTWDQPDDGIGTPSVSDVVLPCDNKLKVSDIAYPFFPNAQTYTIGKSKIIGLAHLSVPLSQDSYAKTALIVFCDDGIYTLGVDATGKLAYDTITPFVPEVCTSRNSICMLGGEVLFVSRRGLMTCTDKSVDYFCPKAMGELNHSPRDPSAVDGGKYGTGLNIYYNALHTLALTHEGASAVDGTSFEEFIHDENTVISLLATKRSVLVYNKTFDYSYLIDIVTRTVSKLPQKILMDDKNYPEQIFFGADNNAHSAGIYSGVDNTQCVFQTRPLYMGGILRRSFRVLLRGDFRGYSTKYAGIYVLGSLDGEHWKLMGAKEKQLSADGFHDLGCETYRDEVAYLMVIFVGYLHKSSHIDKMEVDGMYN